MPHSRTPSQIMRFFLSAFNSTSYITITSLCVLFLLSNLYGPPAAADASAINILCFHPLPNADGPGNDGCGRVAALYANVTIVRATEDFPAALSTFDVVLTNTTEAMLLDTFASVLNEFVNDGGGLIVSQPTFTPGREPFPPGFEMTVTDPLWPGFPFADPPVVQFTNAGVAHPILDGLMPEALAGNIRTIPVNMLGSAWTLLAQSVDEPHAGLAVGHYGAGRLIFLTVAGSAEANGDKFVQQMIGWAAQESTASPTPTPTAAPPSGPDLQIDAIEVTQAIQDLNNSVDLIANKRTYVRVHVSASQVVTDMVPGVIANLEVMRDGRPLSPTLIPGNPGGDIMINSSPDRGQIDDSFWFEIPNDWLGAGTVMFTGMVDPNNAKADPNLANNQKTVTVNFLDAPPLPLRLYNVHYTVDGTTYQTNDFHMGKAESWLRRAYPISELKVKRTNFIYPEAGLPERNRLITWLEVARWLAYHLSIESADTYHYGLLDDGGVTIDGGARFSPGRVAVGPTGPTGPDAPLLTQWDRDGSYGDWVMGHEIGHLIGRHHADYCGVGANNFVAPYPHRLGRISPTTRGDGTIYGFDIETRKIYGPNWKDLMTYCDFKWVSDFTYEGIREEMAAASAANSPTVDAEKFLIVSGIVDLSDSTIDLLNLQLIEQTRTLQLPEPGDWAIVLLDSTDKALATYPFAIQALTDGEGGTSIPAVISEVVPWVEGTSQVQIRDGLQVVATKSASANAPRVTIVAPIQDQAFGNGPVEFAWAGADADQESLTYSVLYRHTANSDWEVLTTNLVSPTLAIDASLLPGGTSSYLRVIASDGFLTGEETVGPFTLPAGKPMPTIEAPLADNATFSLGQLVTLHGVGYDREDGSLGGAALTWTSSVDGDLGSGTTINRIGLSTGVHTITLTATDSDGSTGQAQRTISILSSTEAEPENLSVSPIAHIVTAQIGETAALSTTFTLRNRGEASLNWSATKDAAWISLSKSSDSTPSGLTVTVDVAGLALGRHLGRVTFEAGDATVEVPVSVEILQEMPNTLPTSLYLPLVL